MKKTYKFNNLCCANCAAKMERKIAKLPGVLSATINFMSARLTLETEGEITPELLRQAGGICRKIEPGCELVY